MPGGLHRPGTRPLAVLSLAAGDSLLAALHVNGILVSSACGGRGTCGTCRVRLGAGREALTPAGADEIRLLGEDALRRGERLACRPTASARVDLEVLSLGRPSPRAADKAATGLETGPVRPWVTVTSVPTERALAPASDDGEAWTAGAEVSGRGAPDGRGVVEGVADALARAGTIRRAEELRVARPPALLPHLVALLHGGSAGIRAVTREEWLVGALPAGCDDPLGLAIDLGTTTIACYVASLDSGEVLGSGTAANPQRRWGDDLMSRLGHARSEAAELRAAAWEGIRLALARAAAGMGADPVAVTGRLVDVTLVGNSAMHHLALGLPTGPLAKAPYRPTATAPLVCAGGDLCDWLPAWLPMRALPLAAGFVGSDIVGGLVALGLPEAGSTPAFGAPTLYIDIGTNAEMVLCVDDQAWACSAAAGPALEGARLSCGTAVGPGAVTWAGLEDGRVAWRTWDGGPPEGLAGTGALSLLASLWRQGAVDVHGLLEEGALPPRSVVTEGGVRGLRLTDEVRLTEADISELLLARAAVRAGRAVLLEAAGLVESEVGTAFVAGTLGTEARPEDLAILGMVPPTAEIRPVGNAAGDGALLCLLDEVAWDQAARTAGRVTHVTLSGAPRFEAQFVDSLLLT